MESATEQQVINEADEQLQHVKGVVESLLFVNEKPVILDQIKNVLDTVSTTDIKKALSDLQQDYDFKMVAGSTIPDSHSREAEKAFADLNVAQSMPELHNLRFLAGRYWEKRGIPPSKAMSEGQTTPSEVPGEPKQQALDPQLLSAVGGRVQ